MPRPPGDMSQHGMTQPNMGMEKPKKSMDLQQQGMPMSQPGFAMPHPGTGMGGVAQPSAPQMGQTEMSQGMGVPQPSQVGMGQMPLYPQGYQGQGY